MKQDIIDALIDLSHKEPIEDIQVAQICATANISRKTFYTYFKNKEAICIEITQYILNEINKKIDIVTVETDEQILYLFKLIYHYRDYVTIAIKSDREVFQKGFLSVIKDKLIEQVKLENVEIDPNDFCDFVAWETYSIMAYWVTKDFKQTPEEMLMYIKGMFG